MREPRNVPSLFPRHTGGLPRPAAGLRGALAATWALWAVAAQAATYNVSDAAGLQAALAAVRAGDEIVLQAGATIQYSSGALNGAYFYSGANGTAAAPIVLRSASTTQRATIRGNDLASKIVLRIEGDHWVVRDVNIAYGQKGLVFDNSNYSRAMDCKVSQTGYEAIHVRDGSDHVTIDGCWVTDTGLTNPQFGEGVYIGSDRSVWSSYDSSVDHTTVQNSVIGPDVRAETFDVKEGTSYTLIQNNEIHGRGIGGAAYEDSFIDLKGIRAYVRNNTFLQGGEPKILRAIAVQNRDVARSGYENVVHDNVFDMDDALVPLVEAYSGTSEIYAYNNTRRPAGAMYASRVLTTRPAWYDAPGGGTPPANTPPTVSIVSATGTGGLVAGQPITITASAADSDGTVAEVAFYRGTTLIARDTGSPYSAVWSSPAAGSYTLTAVATDDDGAKTTSAGFPVTVASSGGGGGSGTLVVQYQRGDTSATDNKLKPHFVIRNTGTAPVPLSELRLRYWFTKEGTGTPNAFVDYAAIGTGNVAGGFGATGGNGYYLELSFPASAGSLAPGADTGAIKMRVTTSTFANFSEADDYSFAADATAYRDWQKVVLYRNGVAVWGTAP